MMVMTSLKYSLPWRSRLAFPLLNSFPRPLMAYSWQKSSTLQNSSSNLIVDTSCWCDYPQGYSVLAQDVSFFLIPTSPYINVGWYFTSDTEIHKRLKMVVDYLIPI